ncbi:MAG: hypothetical protein WKF75_07055 [Singulisphaera sp.]
MSRLDRGCPLHSRVYLARASSVNLHLLLPLAAMSRPHFSLGTLLLAVLSAGSPSPPWGGIGHLGGGLFTLAVAVLLVATLGAVHRRDHIRAYWLGFALFGWAYLTLNVVPGTPRLATTRLLDALFARVHGRPRRAGPLAFAPKGIAWSRKGPGSRASGSGTPQREGR